MNGNNESEEDSEEKLGQDFEVEGWLVHGDYKPLLSSDTYHNDIALIRLKTAVKFDHIVRPICLPWPQNSEENQAYFAAGWSNA